MINWMQKHRKYLVVTIWVSTIAFVGAGFVGWGAYSFASSSSWVAKVGDSKVTQGDFDREYSRLYTFYNNIMGGSLDKEQAKNLGLEKQALDSLISKTLMLNFAHDLGLRVSDKEIGQSVIAMEAFRKDGKFNREAYHKLLESNGYTAKIFERALGDSLLLEKLSTVLSPSITDLERESMQAILYLQDRLSIKVIRTNKEDPALSKEEVEAYWGKNRASYTTDRAYEISYFVSQKSDIQVDDETLQKYYEESKNNYLGLDGQPLTFALAKQRVENDYRASQAEKLSLKSYIELKKGSAPQGKILVISESNDSLGSELLDRLAESKVGDVLKPVSSSGGYIVAKVLSIKESQPMEFEAARGMVTKDVMAQKKRVLLETRAARELENFQGEVIGFLGRDDVAKVPSLDVEEAAEFLGYVFQSQTPRGYIVLGDKAVLFEIMEQKLLKPSATDKNLELVNENVTQIKERLAEAAFLEYLNKRYTVTRRIP